MNALTLSPAACPATYLISPSCLCSISSTPIPYISTANFLVSLFNSSATRKRATQLTLHDKEAQPSLPTTITLAMAIPRDPTPAEIARFLSTRSGNQMVQLVQSIREPAAQAALTASLLFAPPAIAGRSITPEKAKKALNAFVGFRCRFALSPSQYELS